MPFIGVKKSELLLKDFSGVIGLNPTSPFLEKLKGNKNMKPLISLFFAKQGYQGFVTFGGIDTQLMKDPLAHIGFIQSSNTEWKFLMTTALYHGETSY